MTVLTCQKNTSHNITGSFPVYSHDNEDIASYTYHECVTLTGSCVTKEQERHFKFSHTAGSVNDTNSPEFLTELLNYRKVPKRTVEQTPRKHKKT